MAEEDGSRELIELVGVLLIALTAVVTSWSAFESSKWGGEMAIRLNVAGAARTESVRASNDANRQLTIDVELFSAYTEAVGRSDDAYADFVSERFPDHLAVAVDAWVATDPLVAPDAPASPFEMDEYVLAGRDESERLAADADDHHASALEASGIADDYTITSVMFATVILFAALASKVHRARRQKAMLAAAGLLFVVTAGVILSYPVIF